MDKSDKKNYIAYIITLEAINDKVDYPDDISFPTAAPKHINSILFAPKDRYERLQIISHQYSHNIQELHYRPIALYVRHKQIVFTLHLLEKFFLLSSEPYSYPHLGDLDCRMPRTIDELEFNSINIVLTNNLNSNIQGEVVADIVVTNTLRKIINILQVKKLTLTECNITNHDLGLLISSNCKNLTQITFNRCKWSTRDKATVIDNVINNTWLRSVELIDPISQTKSSNHYYHSGMEHITCGLHEWNICDERYIGKTVILEEEYLNIKLKECLTRNKGYETAYQACLQFLLIAKHKKCNDINSVDKNIIVKIARMLYGTRNEKEWTLVVL